jgi:colicin import membrane protein
MQRLVGVTAIVAAFVAAQSVIHAQQSAVGTTEETSEKKESGQTPIEGNPSKPERNKEQQQTTATTPKASKKKQGKGETKAETQYPEEQRVKEDQQAQQQIDVLDTAEKVSKGPVAKEQPTKNQSSTTKRKTDRAVGKSEGGRTVYEGPKGGFYYLNEKGDKVYVKDFDGAKIVGKTASGKTIYEGPRGGHFYYNDHGNKVYVKKK